MQNITTDNYRWTVLLATAIAGLYYVFIAPTFMAHSDIGWHIAAGDLIRAKRSIPEYDSWSANTKGIRWYNMSWGWDVCASFMVEKFGFASLVIITIIIGCLITATVTYSALLLGATPFAAILAAIMSALCYPSNPSYAPLDIFKPIWGHLQPDIFLGISPQQITLLFSALFAMLCIKKGNTLLFMPLLMLIWVNAHGGFIYGFLIIALFCLQELADKKNYKHLQGLAVTAIICGLVTFINPLGVHLYSGLTESLVANAGKASSKYITEWQPYLARMYFPYCTMAILYMLLFCIKNSTPPRVPFAIWMMSWGLLVAGIMQLRYMSLFFIQSVPHFAINITGFLSRYRFSNITLSSRKTLPAVLVLVLCYPFVYENRFPDGVHFLETLYPKAEIAYIVENIPDAVLLNHWNYGGYIIFTTRGRLPVFIDGRAITVYSDALIEEYMSFYNDGKRQALLDKYHINTIMMPNFLLEKMKIFDHDPEWKLAFRGELASIYVKKKPY